jgi:hypothetical protein
MNIKTTELCTITMNSFRNSAYSTGKLYASPNIIREIKIEEKVGGTCSTEGRGEKYVQHFGWKT